ncbi:Hypothetical predicted protein [Lecanosticta acicola]|uniref:Uncharacterized protein n=1 Tax=Lecanosticta acicola TaxID=111012 RepID=A0AAI8YSW1_9PEZI|nr:Hypothetical predicted protein [Lecanosticta acicola]
MPLIDFVQNDRNGYDLTCNPHNGEEAAVCPTSLPIPNCCQPDLTRATTTFDSPGVCSTQSGSRANHTNIADSDKSFYVHIEADLYFIDFYFFKLYLHFDDVYINVYFDVFLDIHFDFDIYLELYIHFDFNIHLDVDIDFYLDLYFYIDVEDIFSYHSNIKPLSS